MAKCSGKARAGYALRPSGGRSQALERRRYTDYGPHRRAKRPVGPHPVVTAAAEFACLAGCELSAVCFVRSYVELHFDGPVLRLLAPPVISTQEQSFEFPVEGSRDVLCALIGQTVNKAEDTPDRLALTFFRARSRSRCSSRVPAQIPRLHTWSRSSMVLQMSRRW
jgi:hypothetical protein